MVPVSGEFSGTWVVQTYSVLQYIYDVFFENVCFAHSPQTSPLGTTTATTTAAATAATTTTSARTTRTTRTTTTTTTTTTMQLLVNCQYGIIIDILVITCYFVISINTITRRRFTRSALLLFNYY